MSDLRLDAKINLAIIIAFLITVQATLNFWLSIFSRLASSVNPSMGLICGVSMDRALFAGYSYKRIVCGDPLTRLREFG
jgi:hypothetical protein